MSSFKDLFIAPTFDELEQVARDTKGSPRKLSTRQLRSIRENGSVSAVSCVFDVISNIYCSSVISMQCCFS